MPPHFAQTLHLGSLFDDLTDAGLTPTTVVLRHTTVAATRFVATRLGVAPGRPLTHLRRLRLVDGRPLAVLENYLTHEIGATAAASLTGGGLHQLLRQQGVHLRLATQRIHARLATREECGLLQEREPCTVLTSSRIAYDREGVAVEHTQHVYNPRLFTFVSDLSFDDPPGDTDRGPGRWTGDAPDGAR
ncbi:GntR family transcriptional regulator [Nakamurella deserti]|uniref:GntR family transcriptional regulator n=1 Tax=Nakamurella deserti TaxID=2164074 RepID=UPI001300AF02|nr:GntR family transcriptional regulator [Nakamurella deserti]